MLATLRVFAMNKKNDSDYHRQKAELEEYKLFPLALAGVGFIVLVFYLMGNEVIEFSDVELRGSAKYVWALSVEVLLGLAALMAVSSLSFIICLSLLPRYVSRFQLHPWKPIAFSSALLALGVGLLAVARYVNELVLQNSRDISKFLSFDYFAIEGALFIVWMLAFTWLGSMLFSLIYWCVRAPFNLPEIIEWVKEQEKERNQKST